MFCFKNKIPLRQAFNEKPAQYEINFAESRVDILLHLLIVQIFKLSLLILPT